MIAEANTADAVSAGQSVESDWSAAMRAGDFARAWDISDRHIVQYRQTAGPKHIGPRHLQRIWRGEDLRSKCVLVRCYHGLGDTIQFIRFVPSLRAVARKVIIWCQPELVELIKSVDGLDGVLALHDGDPKIDYDVDIEIMELPHALRATSEMVSMPRPYLNPSSCKIKDNQLDRCGRSAIRVGLVWEAGSWDTRRSIPAHMLGLLSEIPNVRLFSLQQMPSNAVLRSIPAIDISTSDLCQLAGIVQKLDLLISVDTMAAHLGGALGAEVWTLLHADCDWRWPPQGDRTIWYPSMQLFRQKQMGDWTSVILDVAAALSSQQTPRFSQLNRLPRPITPS